MGGTQDTGEGEEVTRGGGREGHRGWGGSDTGEEEEDVTQGRERED